MTPFSVVLVPFPFADLSSKKQRPCLCLGVVPNRSLGEFLIVSMITSNLEGISFEHDLEISDVNKAGLLKRSIVRLSKLVTIESKLVKKTLGELARSDRERVKREFSKMFKQFLNK